MYSPGGLLARSLLVLGFCLVFDHAVWAQKKNVEFVPANKLTKAFADDVDHVRTARMISRVRQHGVPVGTGGQTVPGLHSSGFSPLPEPTLRTGIKSMTSMLLDLMP